MRGMAPRGGRRRRRAAAAFQVQTVLLFLTASRCCAVGFPLRQRPAADFFILPSHTQLL